MSNKKLVRSLVSISLLAAVGQGTAATYSVQELISNDEYRQSFAIDINNAGGVLGAVRDSYNYPFYIEEYLTSDDSTLAVNCALSDAELASGDFDSTSIQCLKSEFSRTATNTGRAAYALSPSFQKIGDYKSFFYNGVTSDVVNVFDFIDPDLDTYTRSNVEQLQASNDRNIIVGFGSAPYEKISFQQTPKEGEDETTISEDPITLWQQEFISRAVVVTGDQVIELPSAEQSYGGFSEAHDISDGNFIAGSEAVGLHEEVEETIAENCTGNLLPVDVCAWSYKRAGGFFDIRPVVWQIDDSGNILSKTQYGLAFEPNEDQTGTYGSRAIAINDLGIAVGYGSVPIEQGSSIAPNFPVVFENGETKPLIEDIGDYHQGFAVDINNNNIIVGQLDERDLIGQTSGPYKSTFFIKDLNSGEITMPKTFFSTAESEASAINDNGLVVGQAEYETSQNSTRRKHGFLYDSVKDMFYDLNDLIACDSVYEIVATNSLNNNGQIVATALKMRDLKDYKGEILINPATGEAYQEQVAVAVIMNPIEGGEIDECVTDEDVPYERKGLSLPLSMTLLLGGLIAIRRRFL